MKYACLLWLLLFGATACDNYPKDPNKSLENATNGVLKVGYSENPPWVVKNGAAPTGIEADLLKEFAQTRNARIEWKNDATQNLLEELADKQLHLVIAGITHDTPWKAHVGLTRPFARAGSKKHVIAVQTGENALTVALEEFLYAREGRIQQEADEKTGP